MGEPAEVESGIPELWTLVLRGVGVVSALESLFCAELISLAGWSGGGERSA